jgi:hypothetical protein
VATGKGITDQIPNHKHQIPNNFRYQMFQTTIIGIMVFWIFNIGICLMLGIWDFSFSVADKYHHSAVSGLNDFNASPLTSDL